MKKSFVLLTCEHGGNKIPKRYQENFKKHKKLLSTHRGLDIGALGVAKLLSKCLGAPLVASEISRLLVDLNRTIGNEGQFSKISSKIKERDFILEKYYYPHHVRVQNQINKALIESNQIIHLGIHSFTPKLNGEVRQTDIGILFDPKIPLEIEFSRLLKDQLRISAPELRVRMNYPYKGTSDGLTRSLRKAFGKTIYAGIEIEINQKFFTSEQKQNQKWMAHLFSESIQNAKDLLK